LSPYIPRAKARGFTANFGKRSKKGVKKNYIVNEALRYYFNAIKTIPEEFILKPITITEEEYERIEKQSQPTKALQRLIRGNGKAIQKA